MKVLVLGHVGFELMAPFLLEKGAEIILVSPVCGNFPQAKKVYLYRSWTKHKPLVAIALQEQVDAVISISGPDRVNLRDSHLKAELEEKYGIKVLANPLPAAKIAVNKVKTKNWLQKHGFSTPPGYLVRSKGEAEQRAAELDFPLVLKSLNLAGGTGFKIVTKQTDIPDWGYPLLLEKYVEGCEYSVEVLNYQNRTLALLPVYKGHTSFDWLHPMERVKLAPAPLSPFQTAQLRRLASQVVRQLNLQPTADIDFVWSKDGPQILEINPRFGGVTALSMVASGILSYKVLVDMLFNQWTSATYKFNRSIALELPTDVNLTEKMAKDLLKHPSIFRIKIQKLKKSTGRIALRASNLSELLHIIKKTKNLYSYPEWQNELHYLLARTQATGLTL